MANMQTTSLVDYLAAQICCPYISDLHFLDFIDRITLAHVMKKISPAEWPLREWNDALNYILGGQAVSTAEDAYAKLLSGIQFPQA